MDEKATKSRSPTFRSLTCMRHLPPEQGDRRTKGDDGKDHDGRNRRHGRCQIEQPLVGSGRFKVLLGEQLDRVGQRLPDTEGADPVGADTVLNIAEQLALGQHQIGRHGHDHHEDQDNFAEGDGYVDWVEHHFTCSMFCQIFRPGPVASSCRSHCHCPESGWTSRSVPVRSMISGNYLPGRTRLTARRRGFMPPRRMAGRIESHNRQSGIHHFFKALGPSLVIDVGAVHLHPGGGRQDDAGGLYGFRARQSRAATKEIPCRSSGGISASTAMMPFTLPPATACARVVAPCPAERSAAPKAFGPPSRQASFAPLASVGATSCIPLPRAADDYRFSGLANWNVREQRHTLPLKRETLLRFRRGIVFYQVDLCALAPGLPDRQRHHRPVLQQVAVDKSNQIRLLHIGHGGGSGIVQVRYRRSRLVRFLIKGEIAEGTGGDAGEQPVEQGCRLHCQAG